MIKKIIESYKNLTFSVLKILSVIFFCIALSLIFVWPLWFFATKSPAAYTVTVLTFFSVLAIFFFYKTLKKTSVRQIIFAAANILTLSSGIGFFIFFVLKGHRLFSVIVIILTFIISGIIKSAKK